MRNEDIEGMLGPLSAAVALYEQQPGYVHEVRGLLRDLSRYSSARRAACAEPWADGTTLRRLRPEPKPYARRYTKRAADVVRIYYGIGLRYSP